MSTGNTDPSKPLTLIIGNKNYSSWSMRPWVLMREAGIDFNEQMIRFDSFNTGSVFKESVQRVNPVGKVPVLIDDGLSGDERFAIWDTLSIAEYLAEKFPKKNLWPTDVKARARARSVCADMHSGFSSLRQHCAMNIEASLPAVGALLWRDQPGVRADVERLTVMWEGLLKSHGGPMLFGNFTIADAYFAPVCMRLITYALPVSDVVSDYVQRVKALPSVSAWIADALKEEDFLPFEEPYRVKR